jgi:hypothetical protein
VREITKKLDIFREYAADLQRAGDSRAALSVIVPVIEAVVENYTKVDDADRLLAHFFEAALDLHATLLASEGTGTRRKLLTTAIDWYMEAEWGLEDSLRTFLGDTSIRLKETRFMLNTVELRMADYRRSPVAASPNYSEEREFIGERMLRLADLAEEIRASGNH